MVIQLGSNSRIKSALKAKVGLTSEGYNPGPLIIISLTPGDRKPSGLEQGMHYYNRSLPPSPRTVNNSNGQQLEQEKREVVISLPNRPSSEHQYNYNSRSGKMERIY
jgi:hypothetical protein